MNFSWITWEKQPRNKSMAKLFEADYHEVIYDGKGLRRYFYCFKETIKILKKDYKVIFSQNPSVFLTLLSVLWGKFSNKKIVIDAHNSGVFPKEGRCRFLQYLNLRILSLADSVIVTNDFLKRYLSDNGIDNVFTLTDPLPDIKNSYDKKIDQKRVFVICSWAEDEPIDVYLDTAKILTDYKFYFSGNFKKYNFNDKVIPDNIVLLGYVSREEYEEVLTTSGLVIDLTLRDNCLVCGAYEAISACRPVILTDNGLNKSVFDKYACYSQNNVESLSGTILQVTQLSSSEISLFKEKYEKELFSKSMKIRQFLNGREK